MPGGSQTPASGSPDAQFLWDQHAARLILQCSIPRHATPHPLPRGAERRPPPQLGVTSRRRAAPPPPPRLIWGDPEDPRGEGWGVNMGCQQPQPWVWHGSGRVGRAGQSISPAALPAAGPCQGALRKEPVFTTAGFFPWQPTLPARPGTFPSPHPAASPACPCAPRTGPAPAPRIY